MLMNEDHPQNRPIWANSRDTEAVYSVLPTISQWLMECNDSHTSVCVTYRGSDLPALPTRCIDVGAATESIAPRLVHSSGLHGRYTTLSHRWGGTSPMKTTKSTLDSLCSSIQFHAMPKTYKDAIVITRGLGIKYIWIDSLCIIQGERPTKSILQGGH
jgi:hypothetical protein